MRCTECGNLVSPVVAIDIDGTLAEYHDHLHMFMTYYFGRRLPMGWQGEPDEWQDYLGISTAEYREAKLAFRQGGFKRWMPIRRGAEELCDAARRLGAEIWITTTRPWMRLDSVDPDTREWLRRNRIQFDHLLYDDHKYRVLADLVGRERVVFVLDDLAEMYDESVEVMNPGVTFLVERTHNRAVRGERLSVPSLWDASEQMGINIREWRKHYG